MTRINAGFPVKQLSNKHLIAEHREIKRVPNVVKKKQEIGAIPESFRLGTGHVRFFYDKLEYLRLRYEEIYAECLERKFNVTYFGNAWDDVQPHLMNDWIPTDEAKQLIIDRIEERSTKTKK